MKVKLPDLDVFAIDAIGAALPVAKASGAYAHVGTTLFNMAVNPKSGKVYVTNTDAHNDVRFEGHNAGFSSVRGHIADSRITVIDPATGSVTPHDLNPHVDFTQDGNPAEKALSVAFPQDVHGVARRHEAVHRRAGLGEARHLQHRRRRGGQHRRRRSPTRSCSRAAARPASRVDDAIEPRLRAHALRQQHLGRRPRAPRREVGKVTMFNPEPASVTTGRKYLYDANLTSQHGTTACASCHIGGDKDELAWDLGNPGGGPLPITHARHDGSATSTSSPSRRRSSRSCCRRSRRSSLYNMPVKGPMTTQTLRGMDNHGADALAR